MPPCPLPLPNWSRFRTIQQVLDELCAVYGFEAALLVGDEGLPLAVGRPGGHPAPNSDADALAAIAGDLKMAAQKAQTRLGWGSLSEINIVTREGGRLVGRPILSPDQNLILVVLIPSWMSYHRALTQAAEVIVWAWTKRGMRIGVDAQG